MAHQDLTAEFKDPKKTWVKEDPLRSKAGEGGQWLLSQFPKAIRDIEQGLYGSLYHNKDTSRPVLDKNARNKHGKIIIETKGVAAPSRGRTLKSGMFQGGVISRHKQNYDHLHYCSGASSLCCTDNSKPGDWGICNDSLDVFFVLDLTHRLAKGITVRNCETPWNKGVRKYLSDNGWNDPGQSWHSESRFLRDRVHPTPNELGDLLKELEGELVSQKLITP
jgi:hypothetical protein